MWKGLCDFLLVISSNLGPVSYRLATIRPLETDRRTDRQTDRRAKLNGRPQEWTRVGSARRSGRVGSGQNFLNALFVSRIK